MSTSIQIITNLLTSGPYNVVMYIIYAMHIILLSCRLLDILILLRMRCGNCERRSFDCVRRPLLSSRDSCVIDIASGSETAKKSTVSRKTIMVSTKTVRQIGAIDKYTKWRACSFVFNCLGR